MNGNLIEAGDARWLSSTEEKCTCEGEREGAGIDSEEGRHLLPDAALCLTIFCCDKSQTGSSQANVAEGRLVLSPVPYM
jgi:hypothetical protein